MYDQNLNASKTEEWCRALQGTPPLMQIRDEQPDLNCECGSD